VAYLDQTSQVRLGDWQEQNPVMRNFVTSPYITICPTAIPSAQRIAAFENQLGRYVHMSYRDGSHRYIFDVSSWNQTVEDIEFLIGEVDQAGGSCHVEQSYLILLVPLGFVLETSHQSTKPALQLRQTAVNQAEPT